MVVKREEIKNALIGFGIEKGDTVCLQANLKKGYYQLLIEILQELVGQEGCIFVPSFSFSTLDPATRKSKDYDYDEWQVVRDELLGYQAKYTPSDVYKDLNSQMNRYKISRSNHPVYSFTYWGNFTQDVLKQTLNYPISFQHSLKDFMKGKAWNIIVGDSIESSVLIPAIASTMNMGTSEIQRAYSMRNHKNVFQTYLQLSVDDKEIEKILELCMIQKTLLDNEEILCISIQK